MGFQLPLGGVEMGSRRVQNLEPRQETEKRSELPGCLFSETVEEPTVRLRDDED